MGFLDNFGKKVADAGQKTMQKTKEMSDIVRINSMITQSENKIKDVYYQIGKLYVSIHQNDCEEEFLEMVSTVVELEQNVRECREQIQELKGIRHCEICGAQMPKDSTFCSSCGSSVFESEEKISTNDYKKCPNCGNNVENGISFCVFCGKPISQASILNIASRNIEISESEEEPKVIEKYCPNCGIELEEDFDFCIKCGAKL
jgi:hypothetical protein